MSNDQNTGEANRIYVEFEPPTDVDRDDASETLVFMLPGFKKEQLRVQVSTTARVLKISGEIQISNHKYRRFLKTIQIQSHLDTNSIAAKFESGILYIKLSKITNNNNNQKQNVPTQEPQKLQQPNTTQVSDQEKQQEPKKDEEGKPKKELKKDEEGKPKKELKKEEEEKPKELKKEEEEKPKELKKKEEEKPKELKKKEEEKPKELKKEEEKPKKELKKDDDDDMNKLVNAFLALIKYLRRIGRNQ